MKANTQCGVCSENIAKYTCPRCKIQTCCLTCVKKHKIDNECTGIRDKTAYIAIKDFTDTDLLSDYRFLEDTARKVSGTQRDSLRLRKDRPYMLNSLIKEARQREVKLKVLPYPMYRRKYNSTKYMYHDKYIAWKVDFWFADVDVKYTEKSVNEQTCLSELLDKYISPTKSDPVIRLTLKQYVNSSSEKIKLFLLIEDRPKNDPKYYILDPEKTLQENLKSKTILENPEICVALEKSWCKFPQLTAEEEIQLREKITTELGQPISNNRNNRRRNFYRNRRHFKNRNKEANMNE